MAKYADAVCRLCRRQGAKLFLKGPRCYTEKCAISRREYAPGQHGQSRIKLSNYGLQLKEKQKVKKIYGVLERQFRRYFSIAEKSKGVTGEVLLQLLERRLDNVIFRAGFSLSRTEGRQFVVHRHVRVNERYVNIPSYSVKVGDLVKITDSQGLLKRLKDNVELTKERGLPKWLEVGQNNLEAKVAKLPERDDVGFPIQEQLIVELYSK